MISVCVATYNGEKYLQEQLDSILIQLAPDDELIISDDFSTDKTRNILDSYRADPRIKLLEGPQKGIIKNFEHAIKQASGDLIFLADQDDVWLPDKVADTKAKFDEKKETQVVISDLRIVDEQLEVIEPSYFAYRNVKVGFLRNVLKNKYIGAGMAFRRELKPAILPFPQAIPMHDMWIGAMAGNRIELIDKQLTLYRRHEKNASEIKTSASFGQQFVWRWGFIRSLFMRKVFDK